MSKGLTTLAVLVSTGCCLFAQATPVPGVPTGYTNIISKNSGLCLDIRGGPDNNTAGAVLQQYACLGDRQYNQQFLFEQEADGSYWITAKSDGLALTAASTSYADGVPIVQEPVTHQTTQQYRIVHQRQGYYTFERVGDGSNPRECMTVVNRSTSNGAPVEQYACNGHDGHDNQQWYFAPESTATMPTRTLWAVNEGSSNRGSISIYDIDASHKLLKTITPVTCGVDDPRGVVASAQTGKLYVSYYHGTGGGVFALDIKTEKLLWNRAITPKVDRLAISPDGTVLYVPTGETMNCDYINVLDAATGNLIRTVYMGNHSHDAQYPLSGPLFLTTHAVDGSEKYMYSMDPSTYAVASFGPYLGELGPFAIDSKSHYAVNNVEGLWGFQATNLTTGNIVTEYVPNAPLSNPGLLHGIGWTPDETEVWMNGLGQVYVWSMANPMAPAFKQTLALPTSSDYNRPHWLTFDIQGDYAYISPNKNASSPTVVFNTSSHSVAGSIGASEDLLEIDFDSNGAITAVGQQYGIGRAP
ncbi:MAG: RICIN domain-containing protein [Acidobacteriaceae bacterium]|nr:RICIN domain-containing protein [Acidobacteriaceae bacterium]